MTTDDLRAFEALIKQHYPELRIEFKDTSTIQKVLGYLLYSFNPQYVSKYTSTFAPVVYFPSKEVYEANPKTSLTLLAHEFVHLLDTKAHPFWFRFSYMFPQILAPLGFLAYCGLARENSWPLAVLLGGSVISLVIARVSLAAFFVSMLTVLACSTALAFAFSGWSTGALLLGLALMGPWPSPGRVHWEKRGYAMNLAIYCWTFGSVPVILREAIHRTFVGPFYFFMSWRRVSMHEWVDATSAQAASGDLAKDGPYRIVFEFLQSRGMVR